MIVVGVVAAGAVALIVAAILRATGGSPSGPSRSALNSYTGQVASVAQILQQPVGAMQAVPTTQTDVPHLTLEARSWQQAIGQAVAAVSNASPPGVLQPINSLLTHAVSLYQGAAGSFAAVPDLPAAQRRHVLQNASQEVQDATGVFGAALALLDRQRKEAGLNPAGIAAPGSVPVPQPTVTPAPGGSGKSGSKSGASKSGASKSGKGSG